MPFMDETTEQQIQQAKKTLLETGATFVLLHDGVTETSDQRGVSPIVDLLENDGNKLRGAIVADKVIGRAAALLLVHGKATGLYAHLISERAMDVLSSYQIPFLYTTKVPFIMNRDGTDMCPMEKSVLGIDHPSEALAAIKKKQAELRNRSEGRAHV